MWYLSAALKPVGPFTLNELQDKIKRGLLSPPDLVFSETAQEWKSAAHWPELERLGFPAFEAIDSGAGSEPVWVVLHQKPGEKEFLQEGPFTKVEILRAVAAGRYRGEDLIWKKGLTGWARIMDRAEFHPVKDVANELDL